MRRTVEAIGVAVALTAAACSEAPAAAPFGCQAAAEAYPVPLESNEAAIIGIAGIIDACYQSAPSTAQLDYEGGPPYARGVKIQTRDGGEVTFTEELSRPPASTFDIHALNGVGVTVYPQGMPTPQRSTASRHMINFLKGSQGWSGTWIKADAHGPQAVRVAPDENGQLVLETGTTFHDQRAAELALGGMFRQVIFMLGHAQENPTPRLYNPADRKIIAWK